MQMENQLMKNSLDLSISFFDLLFPDQNISFQQLKYKHFQYYNQQTKKFSKTQIKISDLMQYVRVEYIEQNIDLQQFVTIYKYYNRYFNSNQEKYLCDFFHEVVKDFYNFNEFKMIIDWQYLKQDANGYLVSSGELNKYINTIITTNDIKLFMTVDSNVWKQLMIMFIQNFRESVLNLAIYWVQIFLFKQQLFFDEKESLQIVNVMITFKINKFNKFYEQLLILTDMYYNDDEEDEDEEDQEDKEIFTFQTKEKDFYFKQILILQNLFDYLLHFRRDTSVRKYFEIQLFFSIDNPLLQKDFQDIENDQHFNMIYKQMSKLINDLFSFDKYDLISRYIKYIHQISKNYKKYLQYNQMFKLLNDCLYDNLKNSVNQIHQDLLRSFNTNQAICKELKQKLVKIKIILNHNLFYEKQDEILELKVLISNMIATID